MLQMSCWKELGTGEVLVCKWVTACMKRCHCLREIESAIVLCFVGLRTALKRILFNIQLIMKGRSKNITLWDLEVCLLRMVTNDWLSMWNNTFFSKLRSPWKCWCAEPKLEHSKWVLDQNNATEIHLKTQIVFYLLQICLGNLLNIF